MNSSCPYETLLPDHLDHALPAETEQELVKHLKDCATCQRTQTEMQDMHILLAGYERPEPSPEHVAAYHQSLRQITRKRSAGFREIRRKVADVLRAVIHPQPAGWKVAQVAAILAVGIFIGSQFLSENGSMPAGEREPSIVVLSVTPDDIQFMNNYLNKSEIFLLAMSNSQDGSQAATQDLTFSKDIAQNLLTQTHTMEQKAMKLDNNDLQQYLNRLEQVLLEVANMDLESGVYTLDDLKSAIADKQLISQSQQFQHVMASVEQRNI